MKFFNMYKVEQKLFFRSPDVIVFNLAMPCVTFLLISLIAGNKVAGNMGLMVASLCRTAKSLNVATSLLYFPMLLFSGATIPAEILPKGLRFFADILPLGVGINLLKSASIGQYGNMFLPIIILTCITAVCTFIAVKFFRWE